MSLQQHFFKLQNVKFADFKAKISIYFKVKCCTWSSVLTVTLENTHLLALPDVLDEQITEAEVCTTSWFIHLLHDLDVVLTLDALSMNLQQHAPFTSWVVCVQYCVLAALRRVREAGGRIVITEICLFCGCRSAVCDNTSAGGQCPSTLQDNAFSVRTSPVYCSTTCDQTMEGTNVLLHIVHVSNVAACVLSINHSYHSGNVRSRRNIPFCCQFSFIQCCCSVGLYCTSRCQPAWMRGIIWQPLNKCTILVLQTEQSTLLGTTHMSTTTHMFIIRSRRTTGRGNNNKCIQNWTCDYQIYWNHSKQNQKENHDHHSSCSLHSFWADCGDGSTTTDSKNISPDYDPGSG